MEEQKDRAQKAVEEGSNNDNQQDQEQLYTEDLEQKFQDIIDDMGGETKIMQMETALNKFDELENRIRELNQTLSKPEAPEEDSEAQDQEEQQINS